MSHAETLAEKVKRQRLERAEACERSAKLHESFGPSKHADAYRKEAAEWRALAEKGI